MHDMITVSEAIGKMQSTVAHAMERLEGNGFTMSVETDYMNQMLASVSDPKKAKYVTVSLVISADGIAAGDEYCMSLGAMISRSGINDERLEKDIESYNSMVNEALEVLSGYDNKKEGLEFLTKKASEEYEKVLAKIEEERKKSKRIVTISNIVFIVGIALLFLVAFLK